MARIFVCSVCVAEVSVVAVVEVSGAEVSVVASDAVVSAVEAALAASVLASVSAVSDSDLFNGFGGSSHFSCLEQLISNEK
jgi:hypothetical protein